MEWNKEMLAAAEKQVRDFFNREIIAPGRAGEFSEEYGVYLAHSFIYIATGMIARGALLQKEGMSVDQVYDNFDEAKAAIEQSVAAGVAAAVEEITGNKSEYSCEIEYHPESPSKMDC